ncbi:MAG: hypothetical protein Q8N51_00840 [Gammaproteobacteria bacterium]|nr:hypothetical protein [Gammaproteobacteria bacterium]
MKKREKEILAASGGLMLPAIGQALHRLRNMKAAVSSALIAWTAVTFDGTNDYLMRSGAIFSADADYLTIVIRFKRNSSSTQRLFDSGVSASIARVVVGITSSALIFSFIDSTNGKGFSSGSVSLGQTLDTTTTYTLHIACSVASGVTQIYLNGTPLSSSPFSWSLTAATINLSTIVTSAIGSTLAAGSKANADLSLVWIGAGMSSSYYITDPSKFWNAGGTPALGADGSAPGAVPQIFYGQLQDAAGWNAGTNQGTGGNYTMNLAGSPPGVV